MPLNHCNLQISGEMVNYNILFLLKKEIFGPVLFDFLVCKMYLQ